MEAIIVPCACATGAELPLLTGAPGQGHHLVSGALPPGAGWQYLDEAGSPVFMMTGWAWHGSAGFPVLRSLADIKPGGQISCSLAKQGYSICVITLSDKASQGQREDRAGPEIMRILAENLPVSFIGSQILPDDISKLKGLLASLAFTQKYDLICTTGGTGVSPRDITPQATQALIDRELPGFGEAMRLTSLAKTPNAIVSRAVCGAADASLIINLPGSVRGARENLEAVLPALAHTLAKLGGDSTDCGG